MANESSMLHSRVQKKTTVLVKPSKPTPHEVLAFSTLDNDPINESMAKTIYIYVANDENGGKDSFSLLEEALARVLVDYYPFAGKLRRRSSDKRLELICNGDGVPFVAAMASCSLSDVDYLAGYDQAMAQSLVPDYDVSHDYDKLYHPYALQLTTFSCGGFTLASAFAHTVCDGTGFGQFFQALTEMASGGTKPTVKPVWERERLVACDVDQLLDAHELPILASSPYMPTEDTVSKIVSVTARSITTLKAMMMKESGDTTISFTTFEVLSAYVWRSRARALEFKPDDLIVLDIVFGVRNILDPPLPEGYYGNAILDMVIPLTRREIDELSLYEIVKLIKEAKGRVCNSKYVQDEIRNIERRLPSSAKMFEEGKGGAVMMVTDWRNLGFIDRPADFGWKKPADAIPIVPPEDVNLSYFLSPSRVNSEAADGGARVLVTLPRAAMPTFIYEVEALNDWAGLGPCAESGSREKNSVCMR